MASQQADQEPSIEEILDSIRQIISDDEADAPESKDSQDVAPSPPEEDIVDLTEKVEEVAPEVNKIPEQDFSSQENIEVNFVDTETDIAAPSEPEELPPKPSNVVEVKPQPKPAVHEPPPAVVMPMQENPIEDTDVESLIGEVAAHAAVEAFGELAKKASVERKGRVTIEDVVRQEVRPLLKQWLDKHLPPIVERLLQKELEKISKQFLED